jgi:hypothetical protein
VSNFFRAFSLRGAPADLGFLCPLCGFTVRHGIQPGQQVTCCLVTETAPQTKDWHGLPAKSLRPGMPALGSGFLVFDTNDMNGPNEWDDEAANARHAWGVQGA